MHLWVYLILAAFLLLMSDSLSMKRGQETRSLEHTEGGGGEEGEPLTTKKLLVPFLQQLHTYKSVHVLG